MKAQLGAGPSSAPQAIEGQPAAAAGRRQPVREPDVRAAAGRYRQQPNQGDLR